MCILWLWFVHNLNNLVTIENPGDQALDPTIILMCISWHFMKSLASYVLAKPSISVYLKQALLMHALCMPEHYPLPLHLLFFFPFSNNHSVKLVILYRCWCHLSLKVLPRNSNRGRVFLLYIIYKLILIWIRSRQKFITF